MRSLHSILIPRPYMVQSPWTVAGFFGIKHHWGQVCSPIYRRGVWMIFWLSTIKEEVWITSAWNMVPRTANVLE